MQYGHSGVRSFFQGLDYFPTCMSAMDRHHAPSDFRACVQNVVENLPLQFDMLSILVAAINPNLTDITCLAEQPPE